MSHPQTLQDSHSATFLLALEDGPSLPASPAGPMTEPCGQPRARVSHFRSPAKVPELLTRGTFGPTFSDSCVPDGPLSSWESRLRQRLARIGSSECDLTWKASAMSDGVLLSRLVPSTPRTVEIDCGLLLEADYCRTPQATVTEARSNVVKLTGRKPSDPQVGLPDQVRATAAMWITPTTRDHKDTPGMSLERSDGRSRVDQLPRQVAATMAVYPTPSASGFEAADAQRLMERREQCKELTGNGNGFGLVVRPQDTGIPLPQRVGQVLGTVLDGSSATTVKRGVLNPAFPCWLMGYPTAHLSCGAMAMQSSLNSRRK